MIIEEQQTLTEIRTSHYLRKTTSKYVLKKSMEGYLSNEIIYRDKAGFALPIRSWIKSLLPSMVQFFDPKFLNKQGIFNSDILQKELQMFKSGSDANCYFFLSYFVLQMQISKHGLN